jgi:hypothetical protein
MLAGLRQTTLQPVGLEHPDLGVEAVEERHVAGLVGYLGAQEDAHVLLRAGPHHRSQLGGYALLADEERAQPIHPGVALLGIYPLVPIDAVLREVKISHRPLLSLPRPIQLLVVE